MVDRNKSLSDEPVIDLSFTISGSSVPVDHGYALYSSISRILPALHGPSWLGIHPLSGSRTPEALLLTRTSRLTLRLPVEKITEGLPLAGKVLDVEGSQIVVGAPSVRALKPSATLVSRQAIVKLTSFPLSSKGRVDESLARNGVERELRRQMERLDASGRITLGALRELRVAGKRVLGFAVRIDDLEPSASVRVQTVGLGGKRRMGCGIFIPSR